jgi:hypothetical protein
LFLSSKNTYSSYLRHHYKIIFFFLIFIEISPENKTPSFNAFCGFQLGICYEMIENREKSQEIFKKVPSWVRKVKN